MGVIINSGFEVVEKIKILGVELTKNYEDLSSNFNTAIQKVLEIRNFWARFNLSVQGRINICKTFMLSQVGYLGCIWDPDPDHYEILNNAIEKFIIGRLNISKKRIYMETKHGGLGMIPLREYVKALKVSWLKRLGPVVSDNWQFDLLSKCYNNLEILDKRMIKMEHNPVLFRIAEAYSDFRLAFISCENNFYSSTLIFNPLLAYNSGESGTTDRWLLSNQPRLDPQVFKQVKITDISNEGRLNSRDNLRLTSGMDLSWLSYMRLTNFWHNAKQYLDKRQEGLKGESSKTISQFLGSFRKGSKKIRKILLKRGNMVEVTKETVAKTFIRLTGIGPIVNKDLEKVYMIWSFSFLNNSIREFSLKFYSNLLGLNTRVNHFNREVGRLCTFCIRENNPVPEEETFLHLFADCNGVKNLKNNFITRTLPEWGQMERLSWLKFWFIGTEPRENTNENLFLRILITLVNYYIWDVKLRKKRLSMANLLNEVKFHLNSILKQNADVRISMLRANNNFYRRL
jgi:hypothetical protein